MTLIIRNCCRSLALYLYLLCGVFFLPLSSYAFYDDCGFYIDFSASGVSGTVVSIPSYVNYTIKGTLTPPGSGSFVCWNGTFRKREVLAFVDSAPSFLPSNTFPMPWGWDMKSVSGSADFQFNGSAEVYRWVNGQLAYGGGTLSPGPHQLILVYFHESGDSHHNLEWYSTAQTTLSFTVRAPQCTGSTFSNATLCSGDDTGLVTDVAKTLVSSCSSTKCQYRCNSGYVKSGNSCVIPSCTGSTPGNATLCAGDNGGLTANTAKTVVTSCTAAKCEYTCNAGYVKSGDSCVVPSCTGTTPANATLCPGDNSGLTVNTAKTVVSACAAAKCEYTCNAGYIKSGNSCVLPACTGTTPTNATLCAGDSSGLTVDTAKTVVSACAAAKCEYTCNAGYIQSGNNCVLPACTGTTPTNATLCSGDSSGLTVNTARTVVAACTAAKCEYTCNAGYVQSGNSCALPACTGTTPTNAALCSGDSSGLTANTAKTVVTACTAAKCEYTCNAGYIKNGNLCVVPACTGTAPANATLCAGDGSGLTADTPRSVVSSCTAAKCEYTCNAGYIKDSSNTCVPAVCVGAAYSNATLCPGDSAGLSVNVSVTLVNACSAAKCEYTCNPGYLKSGPQCVAALCVGAVPANSGLCPGDDAGLMANVTRTLVDSCSTAAKCEHTCQAGYQRSGNSCAAVPTPVPNLVFYANPITIDSGSASVLSWDADHQGLGGVCTILPAVRGAITLPAERAGSTSTGPLTSDTIYTMSCGWSDGASKEGQAVVRIKPTPTPLPGGAPLRVLLR